MEAKPIRAFYCCYLLRALRKEASRGPCPLYVGSTPNPPRRLAQHNGEQKGGAVKTKRQLWEMACIVTGFPSNIAALQFEWAWHNSHVTKRIAPEERITKTQKPKKSAKGMKKRSPRPLAKMDDKLRNLHLLLRVPSFARWPLSVRFFSEDVFTAWKMEKEKEDLKGIIRPGIRVFLDLKQVEVATQIGKSILSTHEKGKRKLEAVGKGGVDGVDVGYGGIKDHLEKSVSLLGPAEVMNCAVCATEIKTPGQMAVICPHGSCSAASHITCLALMFLKEERAETSLIPISGLCPMCKTDTQWIDLVKEMSLRARGEKDVARLIKQTRTKKGNTLQVKDTVTTALDAGKEDDEEADDVPDEPLPDNWLPKEDDEDDVMSIASAASEATTPVKQPSKQLPAVIEDSEWDEADTLE